MPRLYLVDGFALVFRAYYAMASRPLVNSRGENTQAVHNFFRMLFRAIRAEKPEYLAVVFDSRGKNFRHEMYPEYKANRLKAPEDLLAQLPWIAELTALFGIPHVSQEGLEADDLIASFVMHARRTGDEVRILSGDKDLMQLVDERVHMLVPSRDPTALFDEFGPAEVEEKFGVPPGAIADYLAIVGDSSDNVPGVRGLGDKGARALLEQWKSLDGIYANLDAVTPESARKKLAEGRESASLSYKLVRLDAERPIPLGLEACRLRGIDTAAALPRLEALELKQLVAELARHGWLSPQDAGGPTGPVGDAAPASPAKRSQHKPQTGDATPDLFELAAEAGGEPEETPVDDGLQTSEQAGCRWTCIRDMEMLRGMIRELTASPLIAVDSETTSLSFHDARLLGLSFACREGEAWYLPLGHGPESLDEAAVLAELKLLLEDPDLPKVGQNIKYEIAVLKLRGIHLTGVVCDTMLAAYLLEPGSRVNMDDLAARYLSRRTIRYAEIVPKKDATLADVPLERVTAYAAEDAEVTLALANRLRPLLASNGLEAVLNTIELPLAPVLAGMELAGIRVDRERLAAGSGKLAKRLAELESAIYAGAGMEFNLNSPKQMGSVFFEKLALPPVKKTKTGYSTDEEVLHELARQHEVPKLILEYRHAYKLKHTYLDVLPGLANQVTGRIHTSFNQAVTATGRLSSSDPNLQNIPVREDAGREIRRAFVPEPGCIFAGADYSQIELRILAALSGDPALVAAYQAGEDIHRRTAARIFGIDEAAVDRERRGIAKAINFGVIYGQTAYGLSRDIGISRTEADTFIRTWFEVYSGVRQYAETVIERACQEGQVRTWFGRIRKLPELASRNRSVRQMGERLALNTLVQGTAADLIKLAMAGVHARLAEEVPAARLLLQVHDELLVEAPEGEAALVAKILEEEMRRPWPFEVPLEIGSGQGANWDEVH